MRLSSWIHGLRGNTPRQLTLAFAFLIALGALGTYAQLQRLTATSEDGHLVDRAGEQRMLSTRVIEHALAVRLEIPDAAADLNETVSELDQLLTALRTGDDGNGIPAATGDPATALAEMVTVWEPIAAAARVIASSPPGSEPFETAFASVLAERDTLITAAQRVVTAYGITFDQDIDADRQLAIAISIASATLALGAFAYIRWLAGPLSDLVIAARRAPEEHGTATRLQPRGPSDARAVVVAFNSMTATLAERERQLEDVNASLRDVNARLQTTNVELTAEAVALAQSNRELEEFAYVASHDLQEPLRKIQAFGDRLRSKHGEDLPDTGLDYLDRMQDAAARMAILIRDLLTLSRVTSAGSPFEPMELRDAAEQAVSNLAIQIEESGAEIVIESMPAVSADPTQMVQLFQNLLSNALKFRRADERSRITVRAIANGETCHIEIADNGIGFDNEHAEQIFGVFKRLHGRSEYEGTGIGLATCKKIVARHRGQIRASGTPGAGATFTITLPVGAREAKAA